MALEDHQGYRDLCLALDMNIAGGEAEFTRWGFRHLIEGRCIDVLQAETCGLGGITEYLKVLALAHSHFVPVVNHVWGSAVAQVVSLQFLAVVPVAHHSLYAAEPILEYDRSFYPFCQQLITRPIQAVDGWVEIPSGPGLGIEVDRLGPHLVVCMWDEASPVEIGGYLVVDNLAMGRPSMGGIRLLPDSPRRPSTT